MEKIIQHEHTVATNTNSESFDRISWGAVFAGVTLALVTQIVLSMLGTGIGLSTIDPLEGDTPGAGIGIGAGIWWAVTSIVTLFIGGWVAGHLAGVPRRSDGALHGLLVWGLATLIAFYLLTSAVGKLVSGTFNMLGSVASGVGSAVSSVAPEVADVVSEQAKQSGLSIDDIKNEAQKILRQTKKPELQPKNIEQEASAAVEAAKETGKDAAQSPQQADSEISTLLDKILKQGKDVASQADRDALINVVMARSDMSREEATRTVQN